MSAQHLLSHSDDDVAELNSLISEVNQIDNLTLKHSTVNKICKLLCESSSSAKESISQKISDSKQPSLALKSKIRLELKSLSIDPTVIKLITSAKDLLQVLVDTRETEMEELMDEQAENKFKVTQDLKKRFNLKIALAQKQSDAQQVSQLQEQLREEIKKVESEHAEKLNQSKSVIKTKCNQGGLQIQIDNDEFVRACIQHNRSHLSQTH